MNDELELRIFKLASQGYCCAQIMVIIALEEEDNENEDLVRALSGFGLGIGAMQRTCGVLTGGIAVLGLYAGKGRDNEYTKQSFSEMVKEYIEWFASEFGGTECGDIIGKCSAAEYKSDQSRQMKCGDILARSSQKIREILEEHDFEFGSRDEA